MLRRERVLLIGAVTILALIALWLFVYSSKLQEQRLARLEEQRKRAEVTRLVGQVQQRTEIEQQHAAARRSLEDLIGRVPQDPALPSLLAQVDFALRVSGLALVEITFPQQTQEAAAGAAQQPGARTQQPLAGTQQPAAGDQATVGSVSFQIQVRGRFPQLLTFVQMMESLPRAVVLDGLTVTGSDIGIQSSLSIRAFYLR